MEHTQHSELVFEEKKTDVFSAVGLDSIFQVIYGYIKRDTVEIKMRRYNEKISLVDSSTIARLSKKEVKKRIQSVVSEDKSKVLIYTLDGEERINFFLFDNERNRLVDSKKIELPKIVQVKKSLRKILLTNDGNLILSFYKKQVNANNLENKITVVYYDIFQGVSQLSEIVFEEHFRKDVFVDYDNTNDQLIVCGLYSIKRSKEAVGIYLLTKSLDNLHLIEDVSYISFEKDLIDEVARTKKKKNRVFENFNVANILKRQDGGVLVFLELTKEFSRRGAYSASYDSGTRLRNGWVDYYNEDIIMSSIAPSHEIDWSRVLYKKQFSQDDEAIFSSFYIMKTPSRLRLLYNDEIKRSNTVSEYILDPIGKVARNSLLSTEDQGLKLRFRDAIQISNKEVIVPSENNYELNLVKISY